LQALMVEGVAQKEPAGHELAVVLPAGQYWPALQVVMEEGVAQKEPAAHEAAAVVPAGQY
jgi:hypothetical protein